MVRAGGRLGPLQRDMGQRRARHRRCGRAAPGGQIPPVQRLHPLEDPADAGIPLGELVSKGLGLHLDVVVYHRGADGPSALMEDLGARQAAGEKVERALAEGVLPGVLVEAPDLQLEAHLWVRVTRQ